MRCQHTGRRGQCNQPTIDASKFCRRHTNESDRIMSYRLQDPELRERFEAHAASELQTVRDEVILLKTLIEDRLNFAKNDAERANAFNVIHPAMSTLEKLVSSIQKLEQNANILLDKEAAHKLAVDIGKILIEELNEIPNRDTIIDKVSRRIADCIMASRNPQK